MADGQDDQERTEDPTQKRLDDAVKKGDVAKSQEVNTWFLLAGGTLALFGFGGMAASNLARALAEVFASAHAINMDGRGIVRIISTLMGDVFWAIGPILIVLVLVAVGGNMVQHRFLWTTDSIAPKASRISIIAGAKRVFSKHSLVQFAKGIIKLGIVGIVIVAVVWPEIERIGLLIQGDFGLILPVALTLALRLLMGVVAVMAVVAALDWLWTRHTWYER